MQTIKHIYVMPTAKAVTVVMVILGLILGIIVALFGSLFGGLLSTLTSSTFGTEISTLGILSIIAFPILFAIFGFIITAISIWLYNVFAHYLGGVKWDFSNGTLKRLDVLSVAKIEAAFLGIVALVEGLLAGGFVLGFSVNGALLGAVGGLIIGLILGFVVGAIGAFLYNVIASFVGGYKFTFDGKGIKNIDPFAYAKVVALLSAIYGLIQGLFSLILGSVLSGLAATNPAFATMLASSAYGSLGVIGLVLLVVVNLIVGFIGGALAAALYNIPANRNIGRIEMDLV
jgi:hypothetical protein